MKRVIIDANGFLRLLLNDIPTQADQIESLLKSAQKGETEIFLPEIIVFEILFTLTKYYQLQKEEVVEKLESLVSTQYIQVQSKEIFISALTVYKSTNISFVDCFLYSMAKEENIELFTFDKKLKKI